MATLLTFQPNEAKRRAPPHGEGLGKILLFNGVRYERHDASLSSASPLGGHVRRAEGSKNN
jgi:hypothetical protein